MGAKALRHHETRLAAERLNVISTLQLKFGRAPGMPAESIATTPVTVFVGPNNSGKSKVLTEIEQFCRIGRKDASAVILEELTFAGLTPDKALNAVEHLKQAPNPGESVQADHIFIGSRYGRHQVRLANLMEFVQNPSANLHALLTQPVSGTSVSGCLDVLPSMI